MDVSVHGCALHLLNFSPKVGQLLPGMLVTVQGFSHNPQYLSLVGTWFICYKNRKTKCQHLCKGCVL